MLFGDYKRVIKKGRYVQCDHCGDVTLVLKGDCTLCTCYDWWKYMYDKKNGYYTDFDNRSPYGKPGWHITKETVLCPECYKTTELAAELRDLSGADIKALRELMEEVKKNVGKEE